MEKLSSSLRKILLQELRIIKAYGVDQIGYRYFLKDGRSFGLPTCNSWYEKHRDETFYKVMKPFLSQELVDLRTQNFSYVTRSGDHRCSEYIECLRNMNMHNSIGIYKFGENRIDSLFYIYEDSFGKKRDLIFNNLKFIEKHTNKIINKLKEVAQLIETNDDYEFMLDDFTRNKLFSKSKLNGSLPKYIKIIINGKEVCMTKKELEILKTLKYSVSNKGIAMELGISPSTVEKHLANIRSKLNIFTREGLLQFSYASKAVNIFERQL